MSSPQDGPKLLNSATSADCAEPAEDRLPRHFETYLLLKRIAKGGMGEVFLATSALAIDGAERPCVLKVIRQEHAQDSSFLARFLDEARIQAQLEHPGVVRVLLASHDANAKPYVVLEHVEGRNLSEVRLRIKQLGVSLAWPDAVAIAIGLADALAHIHERTDACGRPLAIVHRDLSPQNVMVGYSGDVKVIDFGTARGHNRRCHTVSGIVYAKPGYVAPEVANSQAGGVPADLYAVGVMLWELLAGCRFITGDAAEHLAAVGAGTKVITPIAEAVDAPPELDSICQRLTATKIEDRFESASEACHDLAQLLKRAPSTTDGQRSVRVRISQLMQRLYPAEPTRTRAEFQRLVAAARSIQPPASAIAPSPSPAPAEPEQPAERVLAGTRYVLDEAIGEGASSVVYRATHVDLRRKVALKLYQLSTSTVAVDGFRQEARHIAALNHDNIVKVHDFGSTASGQAYLSMEHLEGESLDKRIQAQGPLEWRSALLLCVQICRALEHAHAAEVIHGDLKPANLFLTEQGTLKLLDFGVSALARQASSPADAELESFKLSGTPEYLAPEQIRGEPASVRTDLYALGVVLFEMLTGARPHEANSLAILLGQKLEGQIEPPSRRHPEFRLPKALDRLCLRLMATSVEQRYTSATEVRADIERILDGSAEGARKAGRAIRLSIGAASLACCMAALSAFSLPRQPGLPIVATLGAGLFEFRAKSAEVPSLAPGVAMLSAQAEQTIEAERSQPSPSAVLATAATDESEQDEIIESTDMHASSSDDDGRGDSSNEIELASSSMMGAADSSATRMTKPGLSDAATQMERALKDRKPLRALEIARKSNARARKDPKLHQHWVEAASATGAWGEAVRAARELARLDATPENLIRLVQMERRTGHPEAARRILERVLRVQPDNAEALALKQRLSPSARVAVR
jgi:eukaryotic-like serine/threonine-protein kinase